LPVGVRHEHGILVLLIKRVPAIKRMAAEPAGLLIVRPVVAVLALSGQAPAWKVDWDESGQPCDPTARCSRSGGGANRRSGRGSVGFVIGNEIHMGSYVKEGKRVFEQVAISKKVKKIRVGRDQQGYPNLK
jgi:hypothetical protein